MNKNYFKSDCFYYSSFKKKSEKILEYFIKVLKRFIR